MSIFSSIMTKLFPASHPAATATPASPSEPSQTGASLATPATAAPSTSSSAAAAPPVDIEQVLRTKAAAHPEASNWNNSIVDLMKVLDLDSSLTARKALAAELHYNGDQNDSAAMNVWLHREVMRQVAANGGTVPGNLKS